MLLCLVCKSHIENVHLFELIIFVNHELISPLRVWVEFVDSSLLLTVLRQFNPEGRWGGYAADEIYMLSLNVAYQMITNDISTERFYSNFSSSLFDKEGYLIKMKNITNFLNMLTITRRMLETNNQRSQNGTNYICWVKTAWITSFAAVFVEMISLHSYKKNQKNTRMSS